MKRGVYWPPSPALANGPCPDRGHMRLSPCRVHFDGAVAFNGGSSTAGSMACTAFASWLVWVLRVDLGWPSKGVSSQLAKAALEQA